MSVQSFQWCRLAKLSAPMIQTKRPRRSTGAKAASVASGGARAELLLEIGDDEARVARDLAGYLQALVIVAIAVGLLQRVLRRDQPPDPVETKPLQRVEGNGAMTVMRRIERAAEQADALAVAERWRNDQRQITGVSALSPKPGI